jgi:hypothetical protein
LKLEAAIPVECGNLLPLSFVAHAARRLETTAAASCRTPHDIASNTATAGDKE